MSCYCKKKVPKVFFLWGDIFVLVSFKLIDGNKYIEKLFLYLKYFALLSKKKTEIGKDF